MPVPTGQTPVQGQQAQTAGPEHIFTQFIATQQRQNELREREIEVQRYSAETERQKADQAHDYSLKALGAQADDRKDSRQHQSRTNRSASLVSGILVVGVLALCGYALYRDKDQLIIEVLKALIFTFGGGGIGYAIGLKSTVKQDPAKPPTP